jgi:integrase
MAPENLISTRWRRFLEQKEREARDGQITARHLRELRGAEKRGYMAFLLDRSIFELDFGLLEDWLGWLGETKPDLAPKTRKHALGTVMTFAHWLHRRREIRHVPQAPVVRVPEHSPVLITDTTQDAILGAIPEAARGAFYAMALMGLRPGEARGLDARAYADGVLTVAQAAKDRRAEPEIGDTKTRQVRRLPCARELAEWIEAHVPKRARLAGGPMFQNPRGRGAEKRWSGGALERTWARACTAALGRLVPMYEGTRHSFATAALARGESKDRVRAALGHTDQRTTDTYAKLAEGATLTVLRPKSRMLTVSIPSPRE